MLKIYLYSKCSTCKEALRLLKDLSIKAEIKEITEQPPSVEELKTMLHYHDHDLKKLFNTSGNLYREMKLADRFDAMSLQEALDLLSKNGMLVKRPFLLEKSFGLIGFNQAEWSKQLSARAQ